MGSAAVPFVAAGPFFVGAQERDLESVTLVTHT